MKLMITLLATLFSLSAFAAEKKVTFPHQYPSDDASVEKMLSNCLRNVSSLQDQIICKIIAEGDPGVNVYVYDDGRISLKDQNGKSVAITSDGEVIPNPSGYVNLNSLIDVRDSGSNNPAISSNPYEQPKYQAPKTAYDSLPVPYQNQQYQQSQPIKPQQPYADIYR